MAAVYATQADVNVRLALYVPDIDGLVIDIATQTAALVSASQTARSLAAVCYSATTLASYAPTYPPDLVDLTANLAAQELIRRVGSLSAVASKEMVAALAADVARVASILRLGALLDADGEAVTPNNGASVVALGNPALVTELTEVYERGYHAGYR